MEEASDTPRARVSSSAPLELMWVLHNLQARHVLAGVYSALEPYRQDLGLKLRNFWADGVRGYTETIVLSERTGTTLDADLERYFDRLDEAIEGPDRGLSLLTESPADRVAHAARIKRLRDDHELRDRYRFLLQSVWEPLRGEWEAVGRPAVEEAATDWRRRVNEGAGYLSVLDRGQVWLGRPDLDQLADSAAADGRLVLSPGWYFGVIHVVEVDGIVYMGRGVRTEDQDALRRETAVRVAGSLKVLADPTRLSILLWLARNPASVTEIACQFDLSQPTVSGHVQLLREAGLLEDKLAGRRKLVVGRDRLERLMGEAEDSMLKLFPGQRAGSEREG